MIVIVQNDEDEDHKMNITNNNNLGRVPSIPDRKVRIKI